MNRWIFVVNDDEIGEQRINGIEVYRTRMRHQFWGLTEDAAYRFLIEPKDVVIFYLAGKKGQKFVGDCKIDSRYCKLSKEEHLKVFEEPFFVTDIGVKLKEPREWKEQLSIRPMLSKLSLTRGKEKWGIVFHHSVIKLPYDDYQTILSYENKL
ncbi:MAG: hypothetical protein ACQCN6_02265 [Candidatus Bathyarchaeia archaeon]|jgi:hypothetical protein